MVRLLAAVLMTLPLCSCLAVAAAGAVVGVAGDVAEAGVKTTGAVIGAMIPDGHHDRDKHDD